MRFRGLEARLVRELLRKMMKTETQKRYKAGLLKLADSQISEQHKQSKGKKKLFHNSGI